MIIIQFQITNFDEYERRLMPDFCIWLKNDIISNYIDTGLTRQKIKSRVPYIQKASWINWKSNKHNINYNSIMKAILDSFTVREYKDNIFKIETNSNINIPNTTTSIDRFIRFINSGDSVKPATDIFTNIQRKLNAGYLNSLWRVFILNELGDLTDSRIVTLIK